MARALSDSPRVAFWTRGLVPTEWTHIEPTADELPYYTVGRVAPDPALELRYYLYGSGGEHGKDPRLRR